MSVFFVALRYLRGGRHSYLAGAAVGIALSLVPIIVTLIVADGMIRGITDRFLELGTGHIQVLDWSSRGSGEEEIAGSLSRVREAVLKEKNVRGAWRERQGMGIVLGSHGRAGVSIRAVDPSFWEDSGSAKFLNTIEGQARLEGPREALLGEALASECGAKPGDTVRLMTLREGLTGSIIPRTALFTVRGIVSSGYHEIDAMWFLVTYEAGEDILSPAFSNTFLTVKTDDPYKDAYATALRINAELGLGFSAFTWKELQRSQYSSYESTRQLLLFIMALIIIVAAVNVSSSTSMLVIERRRDIAVFKAFGLPPRRAASVFLAGASLAGLAGSVLGVGAGLLIGVSINQIIGALEKCLTFFSSLFHGEKVSILDPGFYLETIPIVIEWKTVFLIAAFAVAASAAASYFPARHAGAQKVTDILRKY